MSFVRRSSVFPGVEVITAIEGVFIVDSVPPGQIQGASQGVVCVVGEFPDMTFAVAVDPTTGGVVTRGRPVEIFSAQDLADKLGGFDGTLGEFGKACGNGFVELRNKRFTRLVAVPVNFAADFGTRYWRELPTNVSATDPRPIVPAGSGTVLAGREFRSGTSKVKLAARVVFIASDPFVARTDGAATPAGLPAATQLFDSAGATFVTSGVRKGDILVIGVLGAAGALGTDAGTFRVTVTPTLETQLTIQRMDGSNFAVANWVVGAALPFRVHPAAAADTGLDHQLSEAGGAIVPARPITATVATATLITPAVTPPAASATTWDSLSGLTGRTHPTGALTFLPNVHTPNAPNHADINVIYLAAIDSLLTEESPGGEVRHVWSARKARGIANKLKTHELDANARGLLRTAGVSPGLDLQAIATALGSAAGAGIDTQFGVAATDGSGRDESVDYSWPGVRTFVPEAVGVRLMGADGLFYLDGVMDTGFDGWLAAVLSNLAPERNPGQVAAPVNEVLAPILGIQRGVTGLTMSEYIQFRAGGIAAPRIDPTVGTEIQSGVTTSLEAGRRNINRRRMANFLQDAAATRFKQFVKLPLTPALEDAIVGESFAFLNGLLSPNNPPAQRIAAFSIDSKNGNTPQLRAQGIFVVIWNVRTLSTADFIVLQSNIGENVDVVTT